MSFENSLWIWPEHHKWDLLNSYALFRKSFELPRVPAKAPLFITADQSYQLYVNGVYVCRGPARGFQKHWPYDEVDVCAHLRKGRNVIAVRAHNPGFSNFQYLTEGYAVPTPHGKIRSSWKRKEGFVQVDLFLPKGISGVAKLPECNTEKVSGRSSWRVPTEHLCDFCKLN